MNKQAYPNKYIAGNIIAAKVNPHIKLVIRRYVDRIYYCKIQDDPEAEELVYYERELVEDSVLMVKNEKNRKV